MISKWIINEPTSGEKPVGAVVALPGRGLPGTLMEKFMEHTGLWRTLVVSLEPKYKEWYPQPNGPHDQEEAIAGLPKARKEIEKCIKLIQKGWGLKREEIGVMGFSAGGVMTINLLAHSRQPLAGGVCLGGAILNPDKLPKPPTETPLIVQHNMDDMCFEWEERFVPMKVALQRQQYPVTFEERYSGGHQMSFKDVRLVRDFFAKRFGYYEDFEVIEQQKDDDDAETSTDD